MYQRPSEEDIQKWQREFSKDRLYQNLFDALAHVCCQIRAMTPQEIWNIALQYCSEIEQSENPLFAIDALQNTIFLQMSNYSVEDAERISFLVRFVILYQLTRKQKSWENHPYEQFCIALIRQLETNPLFNQLIPMVTEKNDRYEGIYGGELDAYDYFKDTQLKTPLNIRDDNSSATIGEIGAHREAMIESMRLAQQAIEQKREPKPTMLIQHTYDWWAIYRLCKDLDIFASFEEMNQNVKKFGFNNFPKNQQNFKNYATYILPDSIYPNWKPAGGDNGQKYFRKFKTIADRVYITYKKECSKRNIVPRGEDI